jgi:F-type H+-transporting ATPase subunit b
VRPHTSVRHLLPTAIAIAGCAVLATAAHAAEGELVLLPQIPQMLVLIGLFLLLVLPVNALVFKPLFRVLDEREARTSGTRARADHLVREADEILARYEASVRSVREESERERRAALDRARTDSQQTTDAARAEVEREIERARNEIDGALASARTSLRTQAQDLARQAASSVLGRAL